MARINEKEILSDELCDKLCAAAREKSKELVSTSVSPLPTGTVCRVSTVVTAMRWC
ncbi:hypothetical protein [Alistipes senegalensis]|uniref:hypothetical protein n=1 Tax=Alistipes senegalensis TaxID=1288121 RepID=UPI001F5D9C44|nr:hypothetical protein [Alistipes senegalensis]